MTPEILSLIKRKEKLFKKFKKYPFDKIFRIAYKTTVSELKRIIKFTKSEYFRNKFNSLQTSKQKWNFATSLVSKSVTTSALPNSNSFSILASQFNFVFNNVNQNNQYIDINSYRCYITPCLSSFAFFGT